MWQRSMNWTSHRVGGCLTRCDRLLRDSLVPYFLHSTEHLGLGIADTMNPGKIERRRRHSATCGFSHATVTERCGTEDGSRGAGVEVHTRDGVVRSVRASIVVVCAGGIENARILFASNRVNPSCVGDDQDLVGRFLMDHPRGTVARLYKEDFARTQRIFGGRRVDFTSGPASFTVGVALSPQIQRDEQLLNCSAWVLRIVAPRDPFDAMSALRSRNGNPLRHVGRSAKLVTTGAARYTADRRGHARSVDQLTPECMLEQRPDPSSRFTRGALGGEIGVRERTRLGLPAPTPAAGVRRRGVSAVVSRRRSPIGHHPYVCRLECGRCRSDPAGSRRRRTLRGGGGGAPAACQPDPDDRHGVCTPRRSFPRAARGSTRLSCRQCQ